MELKNPLKLFPFNSGLKIQNFYIPSSAKS